MRVSGWITVSAPAQLTMPTADRRLLGGEDDGAPAAAGLNSGYARGMGLASWTLKRDVLLDRALLGDTNAALREVAVGGEEAVVRAGSEFTRTSSSSRLWCSQPCCTLAIA